MKATLTSKGQITVPAEIRAKLNLQSGDQLDFIIEDSSIKVTPVTGTLDDLINILPKATQSFTVEEMNEAIAQAACDGGNRH